MPDYLLAELGSGHDHRQLSKTVLLTKCAAQQHLLVTLQAVGGTRCSTLGFLGPSQ